ncbi:hypothetical protein [Aquibacillus salsiterrae]|uniref:Uncharacterized protein n=1 Tax=Aquibacillus salsiterrae TaxID=2950439 RepID=A0A9X3WH37_9BACI|nr:hypothetical protein [Aquibacillus salsiterrae]MDC3417319.1 hypothetical protein [Aquibacillus salsiterrae]
MILRDEWNRHLDLASTEIIIMLKQLKGKKEMEIEQIKEKIRKYEDKRRAEEAFYQSLSPIRKLFASRQPSHHQAVEYIVHVKERLKQIERIRLRIYELNGAIRRLQEENADYIEISSTLLDEILLSLREGNRA